MTEIAASDVARALSGMRKKEHKACAYCGKEFEGIRKARCCSHACTVALYAREHRGELNEKRRAKYHRGKQGQEEPAVRLEGG